MTSTATSKDATKDIPEHVAERLTNAGGLAHIVHEGQVYTLRITRMNKLIPTK